MAIPRPNKSAGEFLPDRTTDAMREEKRRLRNMGIIPFPEQRFQQLERRLRRAEYRATVVYVLGAIVAVIVGIRVAAIILEMVNKN